MPVSPPPLGIVSLKWWVVDEGGEEEEEDFWPFLPL